MTQSSIVISSAQTGTAFTSALNSALSSLNSAFEGATAPTTDLANGKLWIDTSTTTKVLNMRWLSAWRPILSMSSAGVMTLAPGLVFNGLTATLAELNYVDGVTSSIQTQINAKQASSTLITNIAALLSADRGFVTKIGTSTIAPRSLVGGTGITITNANGQAGNPTISSQYLGRFYESAQTALVLNTLYTFAHGFAAKPKLVQAAYVCTSAIQGWAVGDEIPFTQSTTRDDYNTSLHNPMFAVDSTNIRIRIPNNFLMINVGIDGGTTQVGYVAANFDLIMRAWSN